MKKIITLNIILLIAASLVMAEESVFESRDVSPNVVIEIENILGSVTIVGWNQSRVEVEGTLGDKMEGLEFSGDRHKVRVRAKHPSPSKSKYVGQTHLTIRVPAGSEVKAETISAAIDASKVTGDLELETVSGAITVEGDAASLEAESVSGEITLKAIQTAEAETVSGAIHLVSHRLIKGDFQAVSGAVTITSSLAPGGRLNVESFSGSVEVNLQDAVSADFEVTTFSGDIVNGFGSEPVDNNESEPGKTLEFSTGSGEGRISIETFSGSILLQQR